MDNDLREDIEKMRCVLKDATERLRALEHKLDIATDRIIYIGACEQKLRDIRDDLDAVQANLSVLPNTNADVRSVLLRSFQQELDRPRLPEIEARFTWEPTSSASEESAASFERICSTRVIFRRGQYAKYLRNSTKCGDKQKKRMQRRESDENER